MMKTILSFIVSVISNIISYIGKVILTIITIIIFIAFVGVMFLIAALGWILEKNGYEIEEDEHPGVLNEIFDIFEVFLSRQFWSWKKYKIYIEY